jgi:hypothetical protein
MGWVMGLFGKKKQKPTNSAGWVIPHHDQAETKTLQGKLDSNDPSLNLKETKVRLQEDLKACQTIKQELDNSIKEHREKFNYGIQSTVSPEKMRTLYQN